MTEAERGERVERFLRQVRGGLIVSCQALPDEPLYGAELMARMARAALEAGATAVVVGGAITRPQEITARFVNALNLFAGPISRPGSGRGS